MTYEQAGKFFEGVDLTQEQTANIQKRFTEIESFEQLMESWQRAIKTLPAFEGIRSCNIIFQEILIDAINDELEGRDLKG